MVGMEELGVLDLRACELHTIAELREALTDIFDEVRADHPRAKICFVAASLTQLKYLRLERYERYGLAAKHWKPKTVLGHQIEFYDREDGVPCGNCRKLHEGLYEDD
jgi:hypothetical protein